MELKKYLRNKGFFIKKIKFKNLNKGDVAIVLLKGFSDIDDWHWMCWPKSSSLEIMDFFSEDTRVISTYLITKP